MYQFKCLKMPQGALAMYKLSEDKDNKCAHPQCKKSKLLSRGSQDSEQEEAGSCANMEPHHATLVPCNTNGCFHFRIGTPDGDSNCLDIMFAIQ
jgi:hypothetical protein